MITRRRMLAWFALTVGDVRVGLPQSSSRVYRVGCVAGRDARSARPNVAAFLAGMRELGYVEGKNLVFEARYAEGRYERYSAFAAELVQLKVDVILVIAGDTATRAVLELTRSIPIVVAASLDPIGNGFAETLARPGRNVTGLTTTEVDLVAKQLELLANALPNLTAVACLTNPGTMGHVALLAQSAAAAQSLGIKLMHLQARSAQQIEDAFEQMHRRDMRALIIAPDAFFHSVLERLAELAIKFRLASIAATPEYPNAGGLISYGEDRAYSFRRAALYVDKILRGAKPAELPIEQPTKLQLVVNLRTAKQLGVKIPPALFVSADRIIE